MRPVAFLALASAVLAFAANSTRPASAAFMYVNGMTKPYPPTVAYSPPEKGNFVVTATLQDSVYSLPLGYTSRTS